MCRKGLIGANSTFSWWMGWMAWKEHGCPADYKAVYPDVWLEGRGEMKLFGFPFTQKIKLHELSTEGLKLNSFSYS